MVSSARTRSNRHKQEHKFCLNIRKHFCAVQAMKPWHRLPREGLGGSSLGFSGSHLDVGLGPLLRVALMEQGWHQRDTELHSSISHSVIL